VEYRQRRQLVVCAPNGRAQRRSRGQRVD